MLLFFLIKSGKIEKAFLKTIDRISMELYIDNW